MQQKKEWVKVEEWQLDEEVKLNEGWEMLMGYWGETRTFYIRRKENATESG